MGAGREPPGSDDRDGTSPSDEDLARRFVAGDQEAFDLLVHRHRDGIYRFVRWHLGGPAGEAEDVTQDVLIEVYRCLPRYEGRSRLRTWMLALAHNLCRRSRRASCGARRALVPDETADEALRTVADADADLDALLARRELQAQVRSAIESLGPQHRDVLLLREIEGLSYHEIARILQIPPGTVRSRLHNARVALATCLLGCVKKEDAG